MGLLRKLTKRHHFRRVIIYISMCCLIFNLVPSVTLAGPEGAEVVHGQVSFQQSGLNTTIHASDKSIINYGSFDIARPEVVQFMQPSSSASVLNRILSANPTCIDGTLLANGRVFFVNPAGVIIGGGARINVNQLVASGLNISNDSFINGQYEFVGGGGTVANYGDISARSVYLVGKQVTNAGNINCPDGYVIMAAGDRVFLGQPGSSVIVEIGSLEPPDQTDAQPSAEVTNEGTVKAVGGTIILAAAGDAFSRPIMTNTGSLSTSNAKGDAGDISLQADDGQIDNAGTITATSDSGPGGTVTASASEVVNAGTVDASGAQGGTIAINASGRLGQFGTIDTDGIEGDGGIINLTANGIVALGTDSLTTANAGTYGDGGEVIVYSPKAALFETEAQVEAKGGSESGDGGFFEVSGLEYVKVEGRVDLTAINGATGNFLIDPRNIKIVSDASQGIGVGWGDWNHTTGELFASGPNTKIRIGYLETYLDTTNVIMSTGLGGSDGNSDGNITFIADRYLKSGKYWTGDPGDPTIPSDNSLTIIANNNIIFEPGSGIDFAGGGSVTLNVVNNVVIDADISLSGGNFNSTHIESDPENPGTLGIDFDNHFESSGLITTLGGNVDIAHAGTVTIGAPINTTGVAGSGSVEIAGSSITVNDNILAGNNITFYNAVTAASANPLQTFDAGGTLTAMGDIIKTSSGELVLNSGSVLHLGHNVKGTHVNGSSITFNGDIIADGVGVIQEFSATGTLTANGDIEKPTTGTLTLGSGVGTLFLGHNVRGTDAAGSNIVLNGYVIANGVGDNSEQEFYATGDLITNNDIEKSTAGILTLGCDNGVLYLGHNVKGTHVNGSSITFNGNIIANGTGVNSEQEFSATGILTANGNIEKSTAGTLTLGSGGGTLYLGHNVTTGDDAGSNITFADRIIAKGTGAGSDQQFSAAGTLTANGNIKKSTAGTLTLGSGGGTLYLGHNVTTGDDAGSNITFADSIIANGTGESSDQQFSAAGTLTANGTIEKNTAGSLTLGGGALIDLNGAVNVQDGDLNLLDGVVAASGVKLSAGRDVIVANSKTLTGEGTLTVEADRNIMLGGDTLAGDLILTADRDNSSGIDGGTMHAVGTIITTNGDIVISASDDTIILDGDVHADVTDDGDILLNNNTLLADGVALWAGHDIILANGKSMTGDGELTLIADYDGDSYGIIRLGGNVMGDGITFGDSTIVRNNSVIADGTDPVGQIFNAGTGVLKASGTITKNGTGNLTLSGGPLVDLDGAVDVQTGSLTVNATKASLGDNITTLTNQTYNTDVELAGNVVFAGGGVEFGKTVEATTDGGQSLAVNTAGSGLTKFVSTVGGNSKALSSLVTNSDGTTSLGGNVTTTGSQTYNDDVELMGDVTAESTGGADITFAGTVDGAHNLIVNTGGVTKFQDIVGGAGGSLASLLTDGPGTTELSDNVTTIGAQTYKDDVELMGDVTAESTGGADITFAGTVDGAHKLIVNTGGVTKFQGIVGGAGGSLASLLTDGPGTTELSDNVTTIGSQTYKDDVELMGDVTAESTGGADITFAGTVDGAHKLIVDTAGVTKFQGIVGGAGGSLTSLLTDGPGTTELSDNVTTIGSQTYNDDVELRGDVTAESTGGADITFAGTVDGAHKLIVNTGGVTKFQGIVGGAGGSLASLLTDGPGTTELSDNVTTIGAQTYKDDVELMGDVTAESTGGADITFVGTVDGAHKLIVNTGGVTKFQGIVGGAGGSLASLLTDGPGTTELSDNVTTTGSQSYNDDVELMGDVTAESTGGADITFAGTVDGTHKLIVNTSSGTMLSGNVGSDTSLTTLTTDAGGTTYVSGDVTTTSGIIFGDNVTADGVSSLLNQRIDAGAGMLDADGNIEKTTAGNLTLAGDDGIELVGDVLGTGVFRTEDIITFENDVTADGGDQRFDAGLGTLWAEGKITKTGTGDLYLGGDEAINLNDDVDVQTDDGSLFIEDDFHAFANLLASQDITFVGSTVNGELDGIGDQRIDAQTGTLTANGWLYKGDGSLYLEAAGDISLADYVVANAGGVSIISENGKIFTPDGSGKLNVVITGSSNDSLSTGVDLPYGPGKAAIVAMSKEPLNLGKYAELTASGTYDADSVDDRSAIYFRYDGEHKGERIDVAIYIASMGSDVYVGSQGVQVAPGGTMVADAYDTVVFEDEFVDTIGSLDWLEACSRITTSLGEAASRGSLPYADDPETMEDLLDGSYVLRGDSFVEALVLYGDIEEQETIPKRTPMEAEASATSMPTSPEISDIGQIESTVSGDLQWLGEELGLCEGDQQGEDDNRCQEITQAYLAGAFLQASDMRPQQAAAQLRQLAGLLHDTDGSRIAALGRVINEFAQPDVPPSPEQFASIGQAFAVHVNDGTHYATAKQWLDALAEYTMLLISEIGWSTDDSVAFVMSKYGPTVTEASDVGVVAFIQMHLEDLIG